MVSLKFLLVFTLQGILVDSDRKSYSGYQVWQVNGNLTEDLIKNIEDRDAWEGDNDTFNFLLNGNDSVYWNEYLKSLNVSYKIVLDDVQSRIAELTTETRRDTKNSLSWSKQPTLKELNQFLAKMAKENPTYCTLTSIGKTAHKKDIHLFKMSNGNKLNKAILIDAGFHGREWTAILAALFFIESIASNFSTQPDSVKNLDWYILPLMNPDGYEYTMTTDRLWRKNRRRFSGSCYGVDLNRNFDYRWCEKGASLAMCSQFYCGPEEFSEEETKAFRNLVLGKRFMVYMSIHSSGTKVLYPWNFGGGGHTFDWNKHQSITKEIAMAMRSVAHTHYTNGNIQKMGVQRGAGLSIDWMYFKQDISHSYMIETRGRIGLDLIDWHDVSIAVREVRAGLLRLAQLCYHK